MQNEEIASGKSGDPPKADQNLFVAAYVLFKRIPITWRVVGGAIAGVLILAAVARWLPNMKERMKFFTESALGWLVFVIVAVQAYIYQWQAKIMREALIIGERAYVGVHSIAEDFKKERIILTVENTGNIPAEDLKIAGYVWVIIPRGVGLASLRNPLFESANCTFNQTFRNIKLFRGNLKSRITIDLFKITLTNKTYIPSVAGGHGTLWLIGSIEYNDGFVPGQVSHFAFTYEGNGEWAGRSIEQLGDMKKGDKTQENPEAN